MPFEAGRVAVADVSNSLHSYKRKSAVMADIPIAHTYRFGEFTIGPGGLNRCEKRQSIRPIPLRILYHLVAHAFTPVKKTDLSVFLTAGAREPYANIIEAHLTAIRKVLEENPNDPQYFRPYKNGQPLFFHGTDIWTGNGWRNLANTYDSRRPKTASQSLVSA